jgi:tRNA nucleotidyltransferase (CCA-adding enzyme)
VESKGIGHFHRHPQASAVMAGEALRRLRYDNALRDRVVTLITWHDTVVGPSPPLIRRWLGRLGEEAYRQLLEVQWADNAAKNPRYGGSKQRQIAETRLTLETVLREGSCYRLGDLAVKGGDLLAAGYRPGPLLGKELERLLTLVIDGTTENSKPALLKAMKPPEGNEYLIT